MKPKQKTKRRRLFLDDEEGKSDCNIMKRPFDAIFSWVAALEIPRDSYELLYRLVITPATSKVLQGGPKKCPTLWKCRLVFVG